MKQKEKVIILLSTYNAERYLREQLDSLLAQTCQPDEILIRDDGSKDGTIEILEEYSKKAENVTYYMGENLGAKDSFLDLVKHAKDRDFAFCGFCDQDDYWKPEKIERAVKMLQQEGEGPVLYCGKTQLVDADLNPLPEQIHRRVRPSFYNALVENVVTGCTTLLNRSMYDLLLSYMPRYCIMHDWWMYLVASCLGKVVYDETPYILYRQHGDNVMGLESQYHMEMKNRMAKFKSRKSNISMQAEELVRLLKKNNIEQVEQGELGECLKTAGLLAHYKESMKSRLILAFGHKVFRQRRMDDVIFRVLFLMGMR